MHPPTIIEYASLSLDDWGRAPLTNETKMQTALMDKILAVPMGNSIILDGLSGIQFRWRQVPVDPLLKEMVLAKVNHGG